MSLSTLALAAAVPVFIVAGIALLALRAANLRRSAVRLPAGNVPASTFSDEALERLRGALRLRTDWPAEADRPGPAGEREAAEAEARLSAFQDYLAEAYPAFHAAAERTALGPWALVYRWPGKDASAPGTLLLSHYDVVPADAGAWSADPYGAELRDGFLWGRGAIDTKNTLICALEAAESALRSGFVPKKDVWFAFGGDEERSGVRGAGAAAAWFEKKGVRFDFLVDEGSAVIEGVVPGVAAPVALLGIEEKGLLNLELSVAQKPGHSSRPPKEQAAAVLGAALHRLSRRPFPCALTPSAEAFFSGIAPRTGFPLNLLLGNARLLGPLFFKAAASSSALASMLRTTVAFTRLEGSDADNVMPSRAKAIVNLRLLPGWSRDRAIAYVRKAVADERVSVETAPGRASNDPVPAQRKAWGPGAVGWEALEGAMGAAFPGLPLVPYLVVGTTDSRHYAGLCGNVYRFSPLRLDAGELARMHGDDERISRENLDAGLRFYSTLIAAL